MMEGSDLDEKMGKLLLEGELYQGVDMDMEEKESIRTMTIHASKGREADLVIIYNAGTGFEHDEAEERRVFYVAATRARKKMIVLHDPEVEPCGYLPCVEIGVCTNTN